MPTIQEVKGVGPTMAAALSEKGILTPEQLASIQIDDLLLVDGVGPARAVMLIDAAKEAVGTPPASPDVVTERNSQTAAPQIIEEQDKAETLATSEPASDAGAESNKSEDEPVIATSKKIEQTSQVAKERANTGATVDGKPSCGDKAKSKKSKKSEKAKKAKKAKGDPANRALKKEVKKRRAALKRQKAKLKRAKKALKKIA